MEADITTNTNNLQKITNTKDKAFDLIREMKTNIDTMDSDIRLHDQLLLKNKQSISVLLGEMTEHKKETYIILWKLEDHDIKLSATGYIAKKPWALHSYTERYPILHAYEHTAQLSRLAPLLDSIILQGDGLASIKHVYDAVNISMMKSLSVMHFIPKYEDLTQEYDNEDHILPSIIHPQRDDAVNAAKQYSRRFLLHLQKVTTIPSHKAPEASILQQENSLETSGFAMIMKLFK